MSNPIVSFDEQAVKDELRELVRKTIEETINAMLDEEADQLVGAGPYERTDERAAYRAGHYERGFTTTSGRVTLKMPKLKGMRFATAVIERYKRRETSVEEAIIEMYLAGVSTRRIEDVSEILRGAGVSAGTVSNLNDKAFKAVEEWRCRPLACEYPYVYVDGIYLKRSWGGSYENVAVMVAIGVNEDGYREVIGCAEGFTESAECWRDFLSWLKSRGLRGVRMFVGDKAAGMVGADWAINTSKLMAKAKLMDKIDGSVNQVLTREKAAQMTLNALKAPTVIYDTKGSSVIVNGAEINFGASEPTYVTNTIAKEQTISNEKLTNNGGNDIVAAVSALGYDGYMVALEAIKAAGSTDGTAIRDALAGLSIDAVTGALSFDANGDAVKSTAYIKQAIDGGFQFYKVQNAD